MKKILLLISLFLSSLSNAQEVYYNDVDLTAEGIALKENLATKIIATTHNCYKCIQLSPTMRI